MIEGWTVLAKTAVEIRDHPETEEPIGRYFLIAAQALSKCAAVAA